MLNHIALHELIEQWLGAYDREKTLHTLDPAWPEAVRREETLRTILCKRLHLLHLPGEFIVVSPTRAVILGIATLNVLAIVRLVPLANLPLFANRDDVPMHDAPTDADEEDDEDLEFDDDPDPLIEVEDDEDEDEGEDKTTQKNQSCCTNCG